jgi:hypothetical protein
MAIAAGLALHAIEQVTRDQLRSELQTLLRADLQALRLWARSHERIAEAEAEDSALRTPAQRLAALADSSSDPRRVLLDAPEARAVRDALEPAVERLGYQNFVLMDREGLVLVDRHGELVGRRLAVAAENLATLLAGEAVFTRPTRDIAGRNGGELTVPIFHAAAPVQSASGEVLALLGFAIPSTRSFSETLQVARMGESGETYAFDAQGRMLSRSRFEDQLVAIGLLPKDPNARRATQVEVRDPGGNLLEGHVAALPMRSRPLTRMAGDAIAGNSGEDLDGYADYRGVSVVGAWTWIPELSLGVATEIDRSEAFAGLAALRRVFLGLAGLMGLGVVGLTASTLALGRAQRRADRAQRLGRYHVIGKIGEGGMGKVFLARHAMLRRPTAVKLLDTAQDGDEAAVRFEREVQAASSLTHPNTISVFDYGRTPDGHFYYAMEYLEGLTLERLVDGDGAQPEARVLTLMRQAAASVAEAHGEGLGHRDLKPSNIMVCRYGGIWDFVKVLDFGLVRSNTQSDELAVTQVGSLTGTPLYLSPEALESPERVDARSDVYQLGAIAYYLLSGRHVFIGDNMVEVLSQHLQRKPAPPSEVLGYQVAPELERIVLSCLAKSQEDRPSDARELADAFEQCTVAGEWRQSDAVAWWSGWREQHPAGSDETGQSTTTLPSDWDIDLQQRSGVRTRS